MIGDLLGKKLKDLTDERILVVMDDGLAFLGDLTEHDSNTLILENVRQAPSKEIKWKGAPEEKTKGEGKEKGKKGYIDWTEINLEEVYIRTEHVLRIWRWEREVEEEEEAPRREKSGKQPIYTKEDTLPDERISSMGDIPDTFQ